MRFINFTWLILLSLFSSIVLSAPNVSVTFVLDESGSVSSSNFNLETDGFINALNALPTDGSVEISVVGFSNSTQTVKSLTILTSATIDSVKNALQNNPKNSGGTNMTAAINAAAGLLGGSVATTKVICLATDGRPNSESNTRSAADSAKNSGITLSPIGIGLGSGGKTFLDSIASNPPTPNPTNFTDFSTVVTNSCVGVVKSALNIQLIPDPVDFGTFSASNQICNAKKSVGVLNGSDQPALIKDVQITGSDAGDFKLLKVLGVAVDQLTPPYQTTLPPLYSTVVEIELLPNKSPADASYDAELTIIADDEGKEVKFSTQLVGKIDSTITTDTCFAVKIINASPTIASISSDGTPLKKDKTAITPNDVGLAFQNQSEMKGLVADGNARLFIDALIPGVTSGKVRFQIPQPAQTQATLYQLDKAPTYGSDGKYDTSGLVTLDVDILTDPDGDGRAFAILRAGEKFGGTALAAKIDFQVIACVLDSSDKCKNTPVSKSLKEVRAPVVLIHGLWANNDSWRDEDNNQHGLLPSLERNNLFVVDRQGYNGNLGPTDTVPQNRVLLQERIVSLCRQLKDTACTRVDIVAHSMGGLFTREFLRQDLHKKDGLAKLSYQEGAIRRFIALGTPHLGSPLANLLNASTIYNNLTDEQQKNTSDDPVLVANNQYINDCIIHPEDEFIGFDGGYDEINDLTVWLRVGEKLIGSGIQNLAVGSSFLNQLNSDFTKNVSTFSLAGNVGNIYDQSLTVLISKVTIANVVDAGCDYDEILVDASDGIVPVDSARYQASFSNKYQFDNVIGNYNFLSNSNSEEINNIFHTGMGLLHSRLNSFRKEDLENPEARVINRVIDLLNGSLDDFSGEI